MCGRHWVRLARRYASEEKRMMQVPALYMKIKSMPEVQGNLAWPFDFELVEPCKDLSHYQISSDVPLVVLAQDGTGGLFALCGTEDVENVPIVHITSEGQAGLIANNFNQAVSLIVSLPYWRDLLKFSDGGKLIEMRRALPLSEDDLLEDQPEVLELRKRIEKDLELVALDEPVEYLHAVVHSGVSPAIKSRDGEAFDWLFNTFVVENNPYWKDRA